MSTAAWLAVSACAADETPAAQAQAPRAAKKARPELQTFLDTLAAYEEGGDYETVLKYSRLWQKSHPNDAQVWFVQGRANFYDGDYSAAIASWERAAALDATLKEETAPWLERARALKQGWGDQSQLFLADNEITVAKGEWKQRAFALLDAKNYDEIERVAAQLTASREASVNGIWALSFFGKGLTDPPADRDTQAQWETQRASIEAWQSARPQSELARICLARMWTNGAWRARGFGYGSQIPAEAFQTIEDYNRKTSDIIADGGGWTKMMATSPLAFEAFVNWSLLNGVASDDEQLRAITAAFPQYAEAYKGAAYRRLPRWYGQPGEWQKFAHSSADAVAKEFGAPAGDALYARLVWDMNRFHSEGALWADGLLDYARTKRGIEALLREQPDSLALQSFAFDVATINKDWPSALAALQTINGRVDNDYYLFRRKGFAAMRVAVLEQSLPKTAIR